MPDFKEKKDARESIKIRKELHKEMAHYAIEEEITMAEVVQRGWDSLRAQVVIDLAHSPSIVEVRRIARELSELADEYSATNSARNREHTDLAKRVAGITADAHRLAESSGRSTGGREPHKKSA
jgi:hypothetical protein